MSGTAITRLFLLLAASTVAFAASAAEPTAEPPARTGNAPAMRRRPIAEIDRSAVEFARTHHPELADLLERLRRANPRAYRAAILDLTKDRQRLERLKERAPERYEFELRLWTMDSQIRLLAARAAKGNADEIRPRLKELMQERQDFRLSRMRQERERLTTRLQRVDSEIQRLESEPASDADVDALLTRVKSRFGARQQPAGSPTTSPTSTDSTATTADPDNATTDSQSQTDSPQD
jgi:hypothetical protein